MCDVGDGFPTQGEFYHAAGLKGWTVDRVNRAWVWLVERRAAGKYRINTAADIIDTLEALPLGVAADPEATAFIARVQTGQGNQTATATAAWDGMNLQTHARAQRAQTAARDHVHSVARGAFLCPCCHRP